MPTLRVIFREASDSPRGNGKNLPPTHSAEAVAEGPERVPSVQGISSDGADDSEQQKRCKNCQVDKKYNPHVISVPNLNEILVFL